MEVPCPPGCKETEMKLLILEELEDQAELPRRGGCMVGWRVGWEWRCEMS